jgi:hypothetical protein
MKTTLLVLTLLVSGSAFAVDIEFQGTPKSRTLVSKDGSVRETLDAKEAKKYSVTITRDGPQYYWASRGDIPLLKLKSGAFTTYISPTGQGYIRITDGAYVEHLTQEMTSVTYYGK